MEYVRVKLKQLLNESDQRLRSLERDYISNNTLETAQAYIAAARKFGKTDSPLYYGALWFVGDRPHHDVITSRAIYLSDSFDNFVIAYSTRHNTNVTDALTQILDNSNIDRHREWGYSSRVSQLIGNPTHAIHEYITFVATFISDVISAANRNKMDVNRSHVRGLQHALTRFQALAGI